MSKALSDRWIGGWLVPDSCSGTDGQRGGVDYKGSHRSVLISILIRSEDFINAKSSFQLSFARLFSINYLNHSLNHLCLESRVSSDFIIKRSLKLCKAERQTCLQELILEG